MTLATHKCWDGASCIKKHSTLGIMKEKTQQTYLELPCTYRISRQEFEYHIHSEDNVDNIFLYHRF